MSLIKNGLQWYVCAHETDIMSHNFQKCFGTLEYEDWRTVVVAHRILNFTLQIFGLSLHILLWFSIPHVYWLRQLSAFSEEETHYSTDYAQKKYVARQHHNDWTNSQKTWKTWWKQENGVHDFTHSESTWKEFVTKMFYGDTVDARAYEILRPSCWYCIAYTVMPSISSLKLSLLTSSYSQFITQSFKACWAGHSQTHLRRQCGIGSSWWQVAEWRCWRMDISETRMQ